MDNRLEDARTIARIEGKHAAIRAMNNGSTQVQVENAAQNAIEDYYATIQLNVLASGNTTVAHAYSLHTTADNASGVSSTYATVNISSDVGFEAKEIDTRRTTSMTLVNGTTRNALEIGSAGGGDYYINATGGSPHIGSFTTRGFWIEGVDSDGDSDDTGVLVYDAQRQEDIWAKIKTEEDSITSEVQTGFVAGVYSSYNEGDINNSDLIDPYLGAREYGPDDGFETWAALSLQSLGVNSPDNMSQIGYMEIATGAQVYEGVLLSDGLPQGDAYEVGSTYDASEIAGTQAVVTSQEVVEIEGEFTLLNATTSDGETFNESESITYRNVTYETTNTAEYQDLMAELTETQAEIEARQQQLRSGGGGLFGGAWPFGTIETIIIGGVAILLLTRG